MVWRFRACIFLGVLLEDLLINDFFGDTSTPIWLVLCIPLKASILLEPISNRMYLPPLQIYTVQTSLPSPKKEERKKKHNDTQTKEGRDIYGNKVPATTYDPRM